MFDLGGIARAAVSALHKKAGSSQLVLLGMTSH
jgi:hypothetical protein